MTQPRVATPATIHDAVDRTLASMAAKSAETQQAPTHENREVAVNDDGVPMDPMERMAWLADNHPQQYARIYSSMHQSDRARVDGFMATRNRPAYPNSAATSGNWTAEGVMNG